MVIGHFLRGFAGHGKEFGFFVNAVRGDGGFNVEE